MSDTRRPELDALRGIAALAVVVYHLIYRYHEIYGHSNLPVYWAYFGHYGVQLFFMISGFVIYWTVDRVTQPYQFVISRFSRLYPVYWAAVILTFSLGLLLTLPDRTVDIYTALANLSMLQEYFDIAHVDGVYWTLTLELGFYFWIFCLLLFNAQRFASVLLMVLVCANAVVSHYSVSAQWLHLITLDGYAHFFLFGVALFDLERQRAQKRAIVSILLTIGIHLTNDGMLTIVVMLGLMFLFFMGVKRKLPIWGQSVWVWFGGISYALYLVHQNIGYMIIQTFESLLPSWLAALVALVLVIFIAYILNRWIEVPSNNRLRDRLTALVKGMNNSS